MPCFTRVKEADALAPKPVHPRGSRFHGLLGEPFVRQHFIVDNRWSISSLTEQFQGLSDVIQRHSIYKHHEEKVKRQSYIQKSNRLKTQCRLGRTKLMNLQFKDNAQKIRNLLTDHKDMQRLYKQMPIHQVQDNINQRTFTMRKERDRLEYRLGNLKQQFMEMLMYRANLENRIKYQNEFVLEEELKSRVFLKKIENSEVRMKAIRTINTTYKKMIQVLENDAIFYEPILRSLNGDMEDQANFIKHILHLGMPAISKFRDLDGQYRTLEMKSRRLTLEKQQIMASMAEKRKMSVAAANKAKNDEDFPPSADPRRYLRETRSMSTLKNVMKVIENIITEVKISTLCSQAKEIYPRLKNRTENNEKMARITIFDTMFFESLADKTKVSNVLKDILINNLSDSEIERLERIEELKSELKKEQAIWDDTMQYIKDRGDVFTLLRLVLWNLHEILRSIEPNPRAFVMRYPNSYLSLPLLNFDMLEVYSVSPDIFEEDMNKILNILTRKLQKLMNMYKPDWRSQLKICRDAYHNEFMTYVNYADVAFEDNPDVAPTQIAQEERIPGSVPTSKQIKALSTKTVEEAIRLKLQ